MATGLDDTDDLTLAQLTEAEIAELNELIDPDNEMLPASERMPPQTTKAPTGPYNRQKLLDHLKTEALNSKVGEDYIPYVPKSKPSPPVEKKKEEPKVLKSTFPSEYDEILEGLDEDDIAELASELGLHGLVNQSQSRGDITDGSAKYVPKQITITDDRPQDTDVGESIARLQQNDPSLSELNLNNHPKMNAQYHQRLVTALRDNTYLKKLSLANTRIDDNVASLYADMLRSNLYLQSLNMESNRMTHSGIKSVVKAIEYNKALKELKLANQAVRGGHGIETDIAKMLERNKTLTKFGYSFTSNGPRVQVEKHLMRNIDQERQKRCEEQDDQDYDEEEDDDDDYDPSDW